MKNEKIRDRRSSAKAKGVTAAAAICLIAVGAAAWVGTAAKNRAAVDGDSASAYSSAAAPSDSADRSLTSRATSSRADTSSAASRSTSRAASTNTPSKPQTGASSAASTASAVETVTPSASFFVMPLTGEIVKPFSSDELQYSMTYGDWRLHEGVDIRGELGAQIKAAGDGTVTDVGEDIKRGKTVTVNHGNGVVATYCGFDTVKVKKGDTVKVNDVLGTLGEIPDECIESVHLHFEVTVDGKAVDPSSLTGVSDAARGGE